MGRHGYTHTFRCDCTSSQKSAQNLHIPKNLHKNLHSSKICTFSENLHIFLKICTFSAHFLEIFEQMDFSCQKASELRAGTFAEFSRLRRELDLEIFVLLRSRGIAEAPKSKKSQICTFLEICTFFEKSAHFSRNLHIFEQTVFCRHQASESRVDVIP